MSRIGHKRRVRLANHKVRQGFSRIKREMSHKSQKLVVFNNDRPVAEFYLNVWGWAVFHDEDGCVAEWSAYWDDSLESRKAIATICGYPNYPNVKPAHIKFRTMPLKDEFLEAHVDLVEHGLKPRGFSGCALSASIGDILASKNR